MENVLIKIYMFEVLTYLQSVCGYYNLNAKCIVIIYNNDVVGERWREP
jgi:hypothetical protein